MNNTKYFQWALVFIIFALPSYILRFRIFGVPLTVLELMILTTFAIWFERNYKLLFLRIKNKFVIRNSKLIIKPRRYPFDVEMMLLLLVSFAAVAVAGFSNEALGIWKAYFFEPLLFYILVFNVFVSPTDGIDNAWSVIFRKTVWPLTLAVFLLSLFALYQKITGDFIANPFWAAPETRRVVSVFAYPNALGLYLAPIVLLIIGRVFGMLPRPAGEGRGEGWLRWFKILFSVITITLAFLSIYFAHSEGALVGIVAGLTLFGLLINKKGRLLTVGVVVLSVLLFLTIPKVYDKVVEKVTLSDLSGEVRKQQWRETWAMLTESRQRFIFGAGLANYQSVIKPYHAEGIYLNRDHDPDFQRKLQIFNDAYRQKYWQPVEIYLYPHNLILNFWSELGFFGVLLVLWIIIKFFYLGARLIKNYELQITNDGIDDKYIIIALLSAMTAMVVHGIVDVPYFKNDLAVLFWLIIALMGVGQVLTSEENKKNGSSENFFDK